MDRILNDVLLPVLNVLYKPFDWVLGWTALFGPVTAIVLVGIISGAAITLLQKFCTNQKLLGRCKADLGELKLKAKAAKRAGDAATALRLMSLVNRIGGKYAWRAIKPSFWSVPVITLVCLWAGDRLGVLPVKPGGTVEVRAHFEDSAGGFAHLVTAEGVELVGTSIVPNEVPKDAAGRQARWQVKAAKEGVLPIEVRHGGRSYPLDLRVGLRPPTAVTVFNPATAGQDQLQAVEFVLAPTMPEAWWNLWFQWAGLYMWLAVAVALGLRFALGVH